MDPQKYDQGVDTTIVQPRLGRDGKPKFQEEHRQKGRKSVSSAISFGQWFTDVPGINMRFEHTIKLHATGQGRKFKFCIGFPLSDEEIRAQVLVYH